MITLVLGGARSGKSGVAEALAVQAGPGPVTYLATMVDSGDEQLGARIREHRARRPAHWVTVEAAASLPVALRDATGTVLVDSLGPWVAAAPEMRADIAALCSALVERQGDTVVVSEEVGMGVHPASESGRAFRDALGALNQAVAGVADEVLLVVAGRALRLERVPR